MPITPVLQPFVDGWATHQELLLTSIAGLDEQQIALRAAPGHWAIWQLASHIALSRAYWMHDVLGEGDPAVRDMFRVASTTVPDLSLENAGWEDDETHPRTAAELVDVFHRTWALIQESIGRWTADDITAQIPQRGADRLTTRGWVLWHLMEHDAHHGGAISVILGTHGLPSMDL